MSILRQQTQSQSSPLLSEELNLGLFNELAVLISTLRVELSSELQEARREVRFLRDEVTLLREALTQKGSMGDKGTEGVIDHSEQEFFELFHPRSPLYLFEFCEKARFPDSMHELVWLACHELNIDTTIRLSPADQRALLTFLKEQVTS